MKVLISAYACEPGAASERGVGWEWTVAASRDHDVILLTRKKNEPAIARALVEHPEINILPIYLDLPSWARTWKRGERGMYPYYFLWQFLAWRTARALHRDDKVDVAHHLTFALDWLPAGVCLVPGLPSIWGPVGGAQMPPVVLWRYLGVIGALKAAARMVITGLGRATFGKLTAARASLVVALNREVAAFFDSAQVVIEQNAVVEPQAPRALAPQGRKALFVGRLLRWKGIALAIDALSHDDLRDWEFDIIGEGPDIQFLRRRAHTRGVADRVHFLGRQPRGDVLNALHRADVFFFPSLCDAGAWVVAEAIASGCPVVCLDVGGPGVMVRDEDGTRVAPTRDAAPQLAAAVAAAGPRRPSSDRWSEARLPPMLNGWYRSVRFHHTTRAFTPGGQSIQGLET